jgi:tryptophanyl-tRNA synthetase
LQEDHECFYSIVDWHALMSDYADPSRLAENCRDILLDWLGVGLDPKKSVIFVQSHVAAHSELNWILECLTPMGWLDRMTQFKARRQAQGNERIATGVYTYPVLQTADIVLYDADFVPVGEDQRQHVELARDIAQRLNSMYSDVLTVPQVLIRRVGARVMGLDSPEDKMSKSVAVERPNHAVLMLDPPDVIRKKVRRAQTDAEPAVTPPVGPGVANLLEIYSAVTDDPAERVLEQFTGATYGTLKDRVADVLIEALSPIQRRYAGLREDDAALRRLLAGSAARVSVIANATLLRVQEAVGLR